MNTITPFNSYFDRLKLTLPSADDTTLNKIAHFRELILEENKRQNLTRLTSELDFIEGHLIDCLELLNSGFLSYPALDIGSGAGIPGLLCGILAPQKWILTESEGHKAAFLEKCVKTLMLDHLKVFAGRAENYLKNNSASSITARAVGPITRIYSWIGNCSTWNNLILFKGPAWNQEWSLFQRSSMKNKLKIIKQYEYSVGKENKKRVLIQLRPIK